MLRLADLLRVPRVDSLFDISPDDSRIAFAWNKTGGWQIYELGLSRADRTLSEDDLEVEARLLTSGAGGKFNPRYSPDGSRLAYALDSDGSESYHLVVYDFATQQHTDLTPDIPHALQPNFCWSPYGSQLAVLSNERGHFSAYTLPVNGGSTELILDTGHPAWQVEWSPDGKHLAVCCEMHGQDYGIFIVDFETEKVAGLGLNAHAPRWSPDSRELAFHSDLHGWFDSGVYDMNSKEVSWLTKSEGDSQTPIILSRNPDPADQRLRFAYTQSMGAINWIELLGIAGDVKKVQVGKGIHSGINLSLGKVDGFTSDRMSMVTSFSSPNQPPDLWMIDAESGKSTQLTHSLPDELSADTLITPEEIYYNGMDGAQIPALLFRPRKTPAPAVVMIHGGPNWHYSAEWNPVMAYFACRGYAVLAPNYRGSTGYGRKWQYAARFDLGGVDTRDVAAGAQYLVREGLAIQSKIAVTGRSHGGYLTMMCLTRFPELWCAGSAVVPFLNWFKSHDDSREDLQHWNIENMGDPKENYQRWYDASPYFFLDRINAPVQLICGGNDPRCPAGDSIDARDKLVALGKQVELLLYEDEGHSFLKIENVLDAEAKRVAFLAGNLDK